MAKAVLYCVVLWVVVFVWSLYSSFALAQEAVSSSADSVPPVSSWYDGLADNLEVSSDLSVGSVKQYDDLTNEHSFYARTHLDSHWSNGSFSARVFLWAQANSDVGFEPRDAFEIGLRQAYIGIEADLPWRTYVGFVHDDFWGSDLASYSRSLPTMKVTYSYDAYEVEGFVSSIPYKKKDALVVSKSVPYVAGLQAGRSFDPDRYFLLNSVSLRWFGTGGVPSELAERYAMKGNSVIKGKYVNALAYSMSTLGARASFGKRLSAEHGVDASVEILGNTQAPKEYAYGLWGDLSYQRYFFLSQREAYAGLGMVFFSVGEDVYLAEFGKHHLGYTGVEGYGVNISFGQEDTKVDAGFYVHTPRHRNMYKRDTSLVKLRLTQKLW
ncbi:MAG: hypothetical protein OXC44_06005 [Proteobacteria bacterium]|nr:hypothetical protein [Pseudomonadota bacterium]